MTNLLAGAIHADPSLAGGFRLEWD